MPNIRGSQPWQNLPLWLGPRLPPGDDHQTQGSGPMVTGPGRTQSGHQTRLYVDTGPVQDKFWAQQAGLGWVAKNGNLITRSHGSWVFLGEVTHQPCFAARCPPYRPLRHLHTLPRGLSDSGDCSPHVVDANRCIAYHTIENRAEQLPSHCQSVERLGGRLRHLPGCLPLESAVCPTH
jgi:epoxyqueuosine reductase QueG